MPRAGDIYEFFKRFTGSEEMRDPRTFVRSRMMLQFGEARPVPINVREVRERCCMIDLENSIFTLAFDKIVDIFPPTHSEPATIKAQLGALACHVLPPPRPARWAEPAPLAAPQRAEPERDRVVRERRERARQAWQASVLDGEPLEEAPLEPVPSARPAEQPLSFDGRGRLFTTEQIVAELAQPMEAGD